jgi:hypothetical protein
MDSNRPKHGAQQEESASVSEGKQLHSALYGMYTGMLHDLTAVLKEGAAKGETAKTTNNYCTSVHRGIP